MDETLREYARRSGSLHVQLRYKVVFKSTYLHLMNLRGVKIGYAKIWPDLWFHVYHPIGFLGALLPTAEPFRLEVSHDGVTHPRHGLELEGNMYNLVGGEVPIFLLKSDDWLL